MGHPKIITGLQSLEPPEITGLLHAVHIKVNPTCGMVVSERNMLGGVVEQHVVGRYHVLELSSSRIQDGGHQCSLAGWLVYPERNTHVDGCILVPFGDGTEQIHV